MDNLVGIGGKIKMKQLLLSKVTNWEKHDISTWVIFRKIFYSVESSNSKGKYPHETSLNKKSIAKDTESFKS